MPYLFDQLPTDMIYYEIFPYLDYNSKVTANLLLPREDRLRTPLKKDTALKLSMKMSGAVLRDFLARHGQAVSKRARSIILLKMFRVLPHHYDLLQHHAKFREAVIEKACAWSDPTNPELLQATPYTRKALMALCSELLEVLEVRYPFIREVDCRIWSAV